MLSLKQCSRLVLQVRCFALANDHRSIQCCGLLGSFLVDPLLSLSAPLVLLRPEARSLEASLLQKNRNAKKANFQQQTKLKSGISLEIAQKYWFCFWHFVT
ncbi:hypothetical protein CHARACLAT_028828 [Characodon lateralis]|uniref:Uncharacterized protein n=1 Tax=Characodon lateralis TaxID=208331 RepID=A0ABU7DV17_9TELE|nr:hypothetical protein [Characodon lateralis]